MGKTLRSMCKWVLSAVMLVALAATAAAAPSESILYADGNGELYRIDPDGANRARVAAGITGATRAVPSPDGTEILALVGGKLQKAEPSGANAVVYSNGYTIASAFAWSPAGNQIAFAGRNGQAYNSVHVMNVDGSGITQVVPMGSQHQLVFDWGSAGILYRAYDSTARTYNLWRATIAPTSLTRLLPTNYNVVDARYSPDGSKIAFIASDRNVSTVNYIWTANADGSGVTKIVTTPALVPDSLDWKRDGTGTFYNTLAVSARAAGQTAEYKIYSVDVASGVAVQRVQSSNLLGTDFVHWGLLEAVNMPPVAENGALNTPEDNPLLVTFSATDADGDAVTFTVTTPPANGTLGPLSAPTCAMVGATWTCTATATYTPNLNYYGPDSIAFRVTDTASLSSPIATVSINVFTVNDRPVVTNKSYTTAEDVALTVPAPGLLAGATDVEGSALTALVAGGPAHGTLVVNADGSFTYTPVANYNGTDSFTFMANDGTDNSLAGTVTITLTPVNDAPTGTADTYNTNENTPLTVAAPGVLGNDNDVDGTPVTAVPVAGPSNGTLTLNSDGSFTYTPNAAYNGPDSFTYQATDGTLSSAVITVSLNVQPVDDPPVNQVPGAQTVTEDTQLVFSLANGNAIAVTDIDAGSSPVRVTLSVDSGTLTLGGTAGLTFSTGNGTANPTMTFTGTMADINTALNGLRFNPALNMNGNVTLTLLTNDQGNTGVGGPLSDTDTVAIAVTAVNDAPVHAAPATVNATEDIDLVFTAGNRISVSDVDAAALPVRVTLTATNGSLTLSGTAGLTFSTGTGTGDATMTFTGTVADVNSALNNMRFSPTGNYNGAATVAIQTDDQGNTGSGGALTDADTVAITVAAVNDNPVNTVPGAQTINENTNLVFTGATQVQTSDVDAALAPVRVTLAATNGTLTLSGTAGLSFTTGDGTGDASLVFTGTLASVNAALNGMTFTPTPSFGGIASVSITVDDQGNTGSGGAKTDSDSVSITVVSVNDAPVNTVPGPQTVNEDTNLIFSAANLNTISTSDVDAGSAPVAVTLTATNGRLTLGGTTGLAGLAGNGTPTVSFTGSITNVNTALNGLTFAPTAQYNGPATVTIAVDDQGNWGTGGAQSDTDTVNITVVAVNDAPVNAVPGAQTTNEDTSLVLPGVATADIDAGAAPVAVTLTATNGTLTLGSTAGLGGLSGNGTNSVSFTGTLTDVNSALTGLTFVPTAGYNGAATVTLVVDDQGNTGSGGARNDSDTINITVTAVNDAPVNTVPGAQTVNEDTNLVFSAANLNAMSTADSDAAAANVSVTVAATNGQLTLGSTTGLVGLAGNNSPSVTFAGTLANVNNALNGLIFRGTAHYNGPATVTLTVNDQGNTGTGGALSDSDTVNITVTAVNDAPVNTVPAAQSTTENVALVFSAANANAISINDVDAGASPVAVTLTSTNGTLTLGGTTGLAGLAGNGTASVTFTGSLTDVNNALAGLTYTPTPAYNGPAAVTVAVSDQGNTGSGGSLTDSDTVSITVLPVNDPPVNTVPGAQTINEDQTFTFTTMSTSDVDAGGSPVAVTLTATTGRLTLGSTAGLGGLAGNNTANVTFTGTLADVNAALNGMVFTPTLHFNGTATVTLTVNDQGNTGGGGPKTDTDSVTFTINSVNDAPVNTVPAAQTVNEDGTRVFSAANSNLISTADVDAGGAPVAVTLTATNGTLTLGGTTGLVGLAGNNSATVTFSGTLANVNTALAGLTFTPTPNYAGPATVTILVDDQGNTGSGGAQNDTDTINITVAPVNDGPQNTAPAAQTTNENVALVFSAANGNAISTNDIDSGLSPLAVTLTATNGTITLGGTANLVGLAGNGTGTVTFTGALADVNAALNGLSFTPAFSFGGTASVTLTVDDQGNTGSGGAKFDTDTVSITVNAINDAPVNTVPAPQTTNEDTNLVFSTANGNAVSTADIDAGAAPLSVTLTATNGTLTLGGTTGLAGLTGNNTATVTFTGSQTNVNNALAGLIFRPALNYSGAASVTLAVNDQGNTGGGGAQSDTDTINITVNAVNDAPVNTVPAGPSTNEDTNLVFTTISTNDVDAGGSAVAVTLSVTNGTLTLGSTAGLSGLAGNGTNNVSFTGDLTQVNAALNGLTFAPTGNYSGTATLTLAVNDQGSTGSGGAQSDTDTVTITVAAVNDAPVNTVPGAQNVNEDTDLTFTTISTSDPDAGAFPVAVTLTAANGTLALGTTTGLVGLAGNNTATVTFTGTLTDVNNALNGMKFTPASHYNGPASVTLTVNDQGRTGSGGAQADTDTVNITVNAVNDGPTVTVPGAQTIAENTAVVFSAGNGTVISVADVDAGSAPVAMTLSATNGTLTLSGTAGLMGLAGNGTNTVTFTGALADVNSALNGLTFNPTAAYNGPATVTIAVNDQGNTGGGNLTDSKTINLTVLPVNDPPVNTVPGAQAINEDQVLTFTTISTSDVDAGSADVAVTLTATNGTLTLGSTAGLTGLAGDGTNSITFTGTLAETNTALNGLQFTPTLHYNGSATVTLAVNDQGNFGAGGAKSDSDTVNITITAVNDAPVNTVPGAQMIDEDTTLNLNLSTSDVDAGSSPVAVTVAAANGTVTLGSTAGLSGLTGNGTNSVTFTGALTNVNTALTGLVFTPTQHFAGAASVTLTVNDQGNTGTGTAQSDTDTVNITVSAVNDKPVNAVPVGAQSTDENVALVFNSISTSDVDAGSSPMAVTLTATNGTITLVNGTGALVGLAGNGTATVTFTGTLANVNTALNGMRFDPTPSYGGPASLTITVNDQGSTGSGGPQSDTDTVAITVNAVNDAPVNTVPATAMINEDQTLTFTTMSTSDIDAGGAQMAVTLAATNGTLTLGSTAGLGGLVGNGTNSVTFTGTLASVNTALNGLVFQPTQHFNGSATVTLTVNDQGNTGSGGAKSDSDTVNITINAVNDAPQNTVPVGAQPMNEDATFVFTTISTSDVDAGSSPVAVTLTATNGTLTLGSTAGLSGLAGNGTNTVTFSGTIANVNTALNGLTFDTPDNYNGPASVTIAVNDQGATGSGGAQSDTDTVTINVAAVNDPPVNTVPTPAPINEDQTLTLTMSTTDPDLGAGTVAVTLTAANGTVTLGSTAGLGGLAGNGSASVTFTGTLAAVNTALTNMTFTPTQHYNGAASVTLAVSDQGSTGSGGPLTDTDTVAITLNAVNDAPTVAVPVAAQDTAENTPFVFTTISAADVDAGSNSVAVTLSATNGTLTLGSTGGLSGLSGNGTNSVTFTGSLTDVNAALNGLSFNPTAAFTGTATVSVTVNDQGHTGSGGAQSGSGSVTVNVLPVNDKPVVTAPATGTMNEDANLVFSPGNSNAITASDVDAGGAAVAVTLASTNGTLTLGSTAGLGGLAGNGTASISFTGTLGQVNTALNGLRYSPNQHYNGSATVTVTVNDQGNTGAGGPQSDTKTVNITIDPMNDAPVNSVPATQTVSEDLPFSFSTISTSDVDAGTSPVSVTLTATNGTVTLVNGLGGIAGLSGNGTNNVSFTGTMAQVNTALNGLLFRGTGEYSGPASLTLAVNDQGNTGNGTPQTDTDTVSITVSAVNDPPVNTVPGAQPGTEDTALLFSSANGNAITTSDVDAGTNPVQVTLSVTNGTLTLGGTGGLGSVVGNNSASVIFTGTLANVNAAMNGLRYDPTGNFNGAATLTITTNDQGFTGSPGAQTDTDTVTINVAAVNDVPTLDPTGTYSVVDGSSQPIVLTARDNDGQNLTFSAVTPPTKGTLSWGTVNCSVAGGTSTCTVTVTYTANAGASGPDSFVVRASDGTANSTPVTTNINVVARTNLVVEDVTNARYNQPVTLRGTLTTLATGAPISGATVSFTIGSTTVTGTTDGTGLATATYTVTNTPGSTYTINGQYLGLTDVYAGDTGTGNLTVIRDTPNISIAVTPASLEYSDRPTIVVTVTSFSTQVAGLPVTVTLNANGTVTTLGPTNTAANGTVTFTPTWQNPVGASQSLTVAASTPQTTFYNAASAGPQAVAHTQESATIGNFTVTNPGASGNYRFNFNFTETTASDTANGNVAAATVTVVVEYTLADGSWALCQAVTGTPAGSPATVALQAQCNVGSLTGRQARFTLQANDYYKADPVQRTIPGADGPMSVSSPVVMSGGTTTLTASLGGATASLTSPLRLASLTSDVSRPMTKLAGSLLARNAETKAKDTPPGLVGKPIYFYVNGTPVGEAPIGADGMARLNYPANLPAGQYEIRAVFMGHADRGPASGTGVLTVTPRQATLQYLGDLAPTENGLTLKAVLSDSQGGGDLTRASVRFTLTDGAGASATYEVPVGADGTASYLAGGLAPGTYQLAIALTDERYFMASPVTAEVTVPAPATPETPASTEAPETPVETPESETPADEP